MGALHSLATDSPDSRAAIAEAGGIPALVQLLSAGQDSLAAIAARALSAVVHRHDGYAAAVIAAVAARPLVSHLMTSSCAPLLGGAASLCRELAAASTAGRAALVQASAIPALNHVLSNAAGGILGIMAAGALCHLAVLETPAGPSHPRR